MPYFELNTLHVRLIARSEAAVMGIDIDTDEQLKAAREVMDRYDAALAGKPTSEEFER